MKKLQAFIIVTLICMETGLFSVTGWASPIPSEYHYADWNSNSNRAAGKGTESSPEVGEAVYIPSDAHYYNGHYYKMYDTSYTWTESQEYCSTRGGHLMTITSPEEQEILYDLGLESGKNYWIGGTDSTREGSWKWVTGEKWSYTDWAADQPDNSQKYTGKEEDYLQVAVDMGYGWNDSADRQDQTAGIGFICEWEPNENIQEDNVDFENGSFLESLLRIFQI